MSNINEIDKNFKVETNIQKNDIKFYNVKEQPFKIYGVIYNNGMFRRLPESVAKSVSEGVYSLHGHTAGGRVRFVTNSPYIAISAKMGAIGKMPHFAMSGSAGFDLYVCDINSASYSYRGSFIPPFNYNNGYESVIELGAHGLYTVTINFPLYSEVRELYVGLSENAALSEAAEYSAGNAPIVYYGSSITQGGCASRPGNSYEAIISRRFDCDFINLGFSGNAKGEDEIADYIKGLKMSIFVYDYDHNAPSLEHLENTHERMFKKIREAQPNLPIIMLTRPKMLLDNEESRRLQIIRRTYENALGAGDNNVYFISGPELMKYAYTEGTVDNCHPNDWGFASMAKVIGDLIEKNRKGMSF